MNENTEGPPTAEELLALARTCVNGWRSACVACHELWAATEHTPQRERNVAFWKEQVAILDQFAIDLARHVPNPPESKESEDVQP